MRDAALEVLGGRDNHLPALLDAVEQGEIRASSINDTCRQRLTNSRNKQIADRAVELFDRRREDVELQARIARYREALEGPRDLGRGREVFEKHCLNCHKLREKGHEVKKQVGNNNQNMIAINTTSETILAKSYINKPKFNDVIDDKLPEIENENDYIGGKYFIMFGNTYDLNRKLKFKDHGGTSLIKLRYKDKNKNKIGWFLPTTIKAKVQKIVSKMKLDGKIFFYYL